MLGTTQGIMDDPCLSFPQQLLVGRLRDCGGGLVPGLPGRGTPDNGGDSGSLCARGTGTPPLPVPGRIMG